MDVRVEAQCLLPKIDELFGQSKEVFIGTLVATAPTGISGEHVILDIVTFQPQRSSKGRMGRAVPVGLDDSLPVRIGDKYLVFAFGDAEPLSSCCYAVQLP
jgi:hypothetical protein